MANELWIILLYVLGMALAIAEVVLPGVVLGVIGLICVASSIFFAFKFSAGLGWILTGITLASVPAFVLLWLRVINKVLAMKHTESGYTGAKAKDKELLNQEGIALTQLRPAGIVRFGDRKVDCVSEGEIIERDSRVRVIEVKSNRVVVRAIKN